MGQVAKESALILVRLREQAKTMDRPGIRLATIERLVIACDALESGRASQDIEEFRGSGERYALEIHATNIEKYVRSRQRRGDVDWTGPTRAFLSADPDLSSYIKARESERSKPGRRYQKTDRFKRVEEAIESVRDTEKRQLLRHEFEIGRAAVRKLALLSTALKSIPGVDLEVILGAASGGAPRANASNQNRLPSPSLDGSDRALIAELVSRLQNNAEMRHAGLEFDAGRLRLATAPRTTIVKPPEMEVLVRLATVVIYEA